MRFHRHALVLVSALCGSGCRDKAPTPAEPSPEEVQELAQLMCEVGLECTGPGTAECDAVHRSFDDLLFGDRNENCADIWLVFEFHDCRANLGCEDREMATGSFPGTPCYEEAIAAYDAGCML